MFVLQTVSKGMQSDLVLFSPAVADGDLYRLVTSAFMHYGVTHLLFNMYALFVVGPALEMSLGRLRFTGLSALSALGGWLLVSLTPAIKPATGFATGAVVRLLCASFVV